MEVHHISPQQMGGQDVPENGLTICANAHLLIHPDRETARTLYNLDNQAYKIFFTKRNWWPQYDDVLREEALTRTRQFDEPFPTVNR